MTLTNSDRCRITLCARIVVVANSLDCVISLATTHPSVVSGDSRGLLFGPHNSSYRSLRGHLRQAGLLGHLSAPSETGEGGRGNQWASLCDLGLCVEAVPAFGSPSGYALDATELPSALPVPHSSAAALLPPERYSLLAVPDREENDALDRSPLLASIPPPYLEALRETRAAINAMQTRLAAAMTAAGGDRNVEEAVGRALSGGFLEWAVASGSAQQLLDLVRLDSPDKN